MKETLTKQAYIFWIILKDNCLKKKKNINYGLF